MTERTEVFNATHSFYDSVLEYNTEGLTLSQFLTDDAWEYFYQHIRESLATQPAIERCVLHYMNDEDRYESEIRLHGNIVYVTIYDKFGKKLSELDIEMFKEEIDGWDHYECAHFWRFGKSEDLIIQAPELWLYFNERFSLLGGMTVEISKKVGSNE